MKSLAEFVMRGRGQALFVALAGSASVVFCWISAAAIALVTLRRGAGEGAWLLFWALLPAAIIAWQFGDSSYIVLFAGTLALALVLRGSVSLPLTLLGSVPVGLAGGLLVLLFGDAYLEQVRESVIDPYMTYLEQQLSRGGEAVTLPRPTASAIAGMIGAGSAVLTVLCLLLARYWQAALYNPGGFGEEFRSLRFSVPATLALVLLALVVSSVGAQWRTWAMIFMAPLTFAGLGLVHARAHARSWSTGGVALFYVAWALIGMVQLLVIGLAIADSWLDLRRRWGGPGSGGTKQPDGGGDNEDERNL